MNLIENFKEVFSKYQYIILTITIFFLMYFVFDFFTQKDMIAGNLGIYYLWQTLILQFLISLLFGIFISISTYKIFKYKSTSIKEGSVSGVGTFIGLLAAGCPACSVTVATYIGLGSLVSFLPWYGLELKYLGVLLLLYSNYSILNNLNSCSIKNGKRK